MAQASNEPIMIGAEIFIEPGQTAAEIAGWFKRLKESGMTLTRIRLFESYMHGADDAWNFDLFDLAFKAGEKYGVKIYANLFPETEFSDVGGFKFPKSTENLQSITNYIQHVVRHFNQFTSLYGWVPINEPGSGTLPSDMFTSEKFEEWKKNRQRPSYNSNGFTTFELAEQRFLVDYNCWFLEWLIGQIRLYDAASPIHVNNHDIFKNAAEYDFPRWRRLLDSLGGSAHASWHFGYFGREKYGIAMSANAELLRSGAGDIPWLMTELQGGNNTYSAHTPMCPTKEEIIQWLWINIGSGSRGALFWCLNPRRSGFEAGEWALLDFQDQPSDRLLAAAKVSGVIDQHGELFNGASVVASGINVVYTREAMWIEQALQIKGTSFEGREVGGVMKSALAYFEALTEMGIHAGFKEIGEYDFEKGDYSNEAIILSHQVSIPSKYWKGIDNFVAKGGTLIADGLTGFYDENAYCIMGQGFPLREVFGATVKEFKMVDNLFLTEIEEPGLSLVAHLWRGTLKLSTANAIGFFQDEVIASRNKYGEGKVLWIPSLIGLGGRITDGFSALISLLKNELYPLVEKLPITFKYPYKGVLMKVLKQGDYYITVTVNKSGSKQLVEFVAPALVNPVSLFANREACFLQQGAVELDAEDTLVLRWEQVGSADKSR